MKTLCCMICLLLVALPIRLAAQTEAPAPATVQPGAAPESTKEPAGGEINPVLRFAAGITTVPYGVSHAETQNIIQVIQPVASIIQFGKSSKGEPLKIGQRPFSSGFGLQSPAQLRLASPVALGRFVASVGVDAQAAEASQGVTFLVESNGLQLYKSPPCKKGDEPLAIDVELKGNRMVDLRAVAMQGPGDTPPVIWGDAKIITLKGAEIPVEQFAIDDIRPVWTRYPFTFIDDKRLSENFLDDWKRVWSRKELPDHRIQAQSSWTDQATSMTLHWEFTIFPDFPAVEWQLIFENRGNKPAAPLQQINDLDISFSVPISDQVPYKAQLWRAPQATGAPAATQQTVLKEFDPIHLQQDPTGDAFHPSLAIHGNQFTLLFAIQSSQPWQARAYTPDNRTARVTLGEQRDQVLLQPGEKRAGPRIIIFSAEGEAAAKAEDDYVKLMNKYYIK